MPGMSLTTIGMALGMFGGAGAQSYIDKVLGTQSANLVAYWPLSETSGTTADNAEGTSARDGTYNNVTLANSAGGTFPTAPLFNGTTSFVEIETASLESALNTSEGTVAIWAKVSGAGAWSDGGLRVAIIFEVDANNYIVLRKDSLTNRFNFFYVAGGTTKSLTHTISSTSWVHYAMSWSAANDEVKMYVDGTQVGSTLTGLGTWAGSNFTKMHIGVNNESIRWWDGWLLHPAVWDTPLSAAEISALATA